MIRITLTRREWVSWASEKVPEKTIVKEFKDRAAAANWFVSDSYFDEPYTVKAVWEVIEP